MAGHNKWSKVKRLKGALGQKRGSLFSKLAKEISVAARLGGDPAGNARLRSAILAARAQSMPNGDIERAIKPGTGELRGGTALEELAYEGYAPGGVEVIVEVTTDNKNRAAQDLRLIFSKNHGNLTSSGSVSYLSKRRGQTAVSRAVVDEDWLLEMALESGADDVSADDAHHIAATAHDRLYTVGEALKRAGIEPDSQELTCLPDTTVQITDESTVAQALPLCDALGDNDDVQHVQANVDVPEEVLSKVS
jgi:YebC/PmpR family DNA-binding regulatory protein